MKYFFAVIFILSTFLSFAQKERWQKIADSMAAKGQQEQLIKFFEKELKTKPGNFDLLCFLGFYNLKQNHEAVGEKYYRQALKINPRCSECYLNIGRTHANREDFARALLLYDSVLHIDSTKAAAYFERAIIKEYTGSSLSAGFDYNKAIKLDPKNTEYYIKRSSYQANQGYVSLAIGDLNKAIELESKNYTPYLQRAALYYGKKMIAEGMADVNKALSLDSNIADIYSGRGSLFSLMGEHEKALADFSKAIALSPNIYDYYYNRSLEKYALEDMDGSCEDTRKTILLLTKTDPGNTLLKNLDFSMNDYCDSSKPSYYYQRGIAFYNLGKFENAVAAYKTGLKKFPGSPMTLCFMGNAHLAMNEYKNAYDNYLQAEANMGLLDDELRKNPRYSDLPADSVNNYVSIFSSQNAYSIAECLLALGQHNDALKKINAVIEKSKTGLGIEWENCYNLRGNIYIALGKFSNAFDDFDKSISFNKIFTPAYINRAIARTNLASRVKISSYNVGGSIKNQPFNLNWSKPFDKAAKKSEGDMILALKDCNKAIELEPQSGYAYYIRGQIKNMLGFVEYCYDLLKAKSLGYPVEEDLLKGCK